MKDITSKIIGFGSYLPDFILTNDEMSKTVDTSHEWIFERTGICERRIAKEQLTSDLAIKAIEDLAQKNNINLEEIDMLIVATTTPDLSFPSTACIVQQKLSLPNAVCFDVQAVCSGFVYGITIADKFIKSRSHKKVIVVGAEKMSSILDWQDRNTCVLFGDGAGCVLIQAQELESDKKDGIIDTMIFSDGKLVEALKTTGGTASANKDGKIVMNGREVFKNAVFKMTNMIKEITAKNNLNLSEVDFIVPHQANARIIDAIADRLEFDRNKIANTVAKQANTSAASIPLAISQLIQEGKIKKGDLIITMAVGAGLTWGAALMRV